MLLCTLTWKNGYAERYEFKQTMKRAEAKASSYFAVEILYEGIFCHIVTFWIFMYVKLMLILNAANNPITN